jgi:deazaflavin-dependent oxidoreductase (nitroreductase family)
MDRDRTRTDAASTGKAWLLGRFGAAPSGVWVIKHLFSPLDLHIYRWTGGRGIALGRSLAPRLLLTTTGRRTGLEHTVPIFYLRDGERLIICNVNPGFEHPNPWTLNLRARPLARVQLGSTCGMYYAREATGEETLQYWPQLVRIWPAYQAFYERSGGRIIFVLQPGGDSTSSGGPDSHPSATSASCDKADGDLRELQR